MEPYKFGIVGADGEHRPFAYANVWDVEATTGPDRLVLAPSGDQVELLLDLAREMSGPYGILYVLLVPRSDHESGRYQSPEPTDWEGLQAFLKSFSEYFEKDGRHHVWVMSLGEKAQAIYDNHDVIYAYGPLETFKEVARRRGLTQGEVRFPAPHTHCYNQEYDEEEDRVFEVYEWKYFPLAADDDL